MSGLNDDLIDMRQVTCDALIRYRETMREVRMTMAKILTDEQYEDLLVACESGEEWHVVRYKAALAAASVGDYEVAVGFVGK